MRSSLLAMAALAGPALLTTWLVRAAPPGGDTGAWDTADTASPGDTGGPMGGDTADTAGDGGAAGDTGETGGGSGDTACDTATGSCGAAVDTSPRYSAADLAGEEGGWGCATAPGTLALGWIGLVAVATRRRR